MVRWRQAEFSPERLAAGQAVFRPDPYDAVLGPAPTSPPGEPADHAGAFAGPPFDPPKNPHLQPFPFSLWARELYVRSPALFCASQNKSAHNLANCPADKQNLH